MRSILGSSGCVAAARLQGSPVLPAAGRVLGHEDSSTLATVCPQRMQLGRRCMSALTITAAAARPPPSAALEQQQQQEEEEQLSALQAFLHWALANGVEGTPGTADSKIGLYEGESNERGVVSLKPIKKGEVIIRLPMRLAITDQGGEEDVVEGAGMEKNEQLWSVRLAGKLLEMVQQGGACPWQPYLSVLPRTVPSPLTAFCWEDVLAIEYEPMRRQMDHASWLATSACQQDDGRFSREQWDWALSVVHSRTFGAPGKSSMGGVGVRMLVPLVDMLNHAGDYVTSPPGAAPPVAKAYDCVRWDLKAPSGPEDEWHMEVTATRDIAVGEELLLSYGERSNDEFHLHYGFVPPRNPHDDVTLFTDIGAGIDWWLAVFLPVSTMPPQWLQLVITAAYDAAEQESSPQAAEAVLAAVPEAEAQVIRADIERIRLSAGGMVDSRLLAAYRTLYQSAAQQQLQQQQAGGGTSIKLGNSWQQHMRLAVGRRSRELLQGMRTPLLADLQQLVAWEHQMGQQQHCWGETQRHYAAAVAAHEARHGSLLGEDATAGGSPTEAAADASSREAPLLDAGVDSPLAQLLLQHAATVLYQPASSEPGGSSSGSILPVQFRCYKKLICTDAILLSVE